MTPEEKLFQEFMKKQGVENPAWNIEEDRLMTYYEYGVKMLSAGRAMECANITAPPSPKLIQGYTAEQWQEIIDGGYLCEFRNGVDRWKHAKMELKDFNKMVSVPFTSAKGNGYTSCRPAQLKGVMRPIFVEPVDKDAGYVFFDRRGSYLGTSNFFTGATWNETIGCCMSSDCTPTKYIEL